MKIMMIKIIFVGLFFLNLIKITFSVKLLNATELDYCSSTIKPPTKDYCLNKTNSEIVCCFYQMTFPIQTTLCYGTSMSSYGFVDEDNEIKLAGDILIKGVLDCSSNFFYLTNIFIFYFVVYLFNF